MITRTWLRESHPGTMLAVVASSISKLSRFSSFRMTAFSFSVTIDVLSITCQLLGRPVPVGASRRFARGTLDEPAGRDKINPRDRDVDPHARLHDREPQRLERLFIRRRRFRDNADQFRPGLLVLHAEGDDPS